MASLSQLSGGGSWQKKGSGKSKGKDKGKGKGKGKDSNAAAGDNECFQCIWDDCKAAEGQKVTWAKPCCHSCGRPKGVAKSPPLERLVAWAFEERRKKQTENDKDKDKAIVDKGKNKAATTSKDDAAKLAALRAERLAELKGTPPDIPSPAVAVSNKDGNDVPKIKVVVAPKEEKPEADGNWSPGILDNVVMTMITDDLPEALNEILALVAADKSPQEFVAKETPEEALERHMKVAKVTPASETKAQLVEEIQKAKEQLEHVIGMGAAEDMLEPMRAVITKKEEEHRKLEKNANTSTVQKAGLELVRAAIKKQREEGLAAAERGKAKAVARQTERKRLVKQVQEQVLGLVRALEEHETKLDEKHTLRAAAIAQHDQKIELLLTAQSATEGKQEAAAPTPEVAVGAMNVEKTHMQEQLDLMTKEIEKLRTEAATASNERVLQLAAQKHAEICQKASEQFEKIHFAAQESDLPGYEPTSSDQWVACAQLWALLNGRQMAGSQVAFTVLELAECAFAGREVAQLGKNLLGPLWKNWLPENLADISTDMVVPRQAATLLLIALQPLKEQFEDLKKHQIEAGAALEKLHENHKRRKIA